MAPPLQLAMEFDEQDVRQLPRKGRLRSPFRRRLMISPDITPAGFEDAADQPKQSLIFDMTLHLGHQNNSGKRTDLPR